MVVVKNLNSSKRREPNGKIDQKKALIVAQEISFAKILAGNDKRLRNRGVNRLSRWLKARSRSDFDLKKDDYLRLWKGLFYCMWMADKPLFQEELAETISSLIHCFERPGPSIKFIEGFFNIMSSEWKGIDQHRLEKFLMFVRRFLRQCLVFVDRSEWNMEISEKVSAVFQSTLLPNHDSQSKVQPSLGLVMHFTEIFLEELAKVSGGELDESILLCFLKPFAHHLASSRDSRIRNHIRSHIFIRLLQQTPAGLEYEERFSAWAELGCPGGSINVMQRNDDDNNVEEEEDGGDVGADADDEIIQNAVNGKAPLDPRAGGISVELPLINFDPLHVAKFLEEFKFKKFTNTKTRKSLADLVSKFEKLAEGEYPLGIKEVPEAPSVNVRRFAEKAARKLLKYENRLKKAEKVEEENDDTEEIHALGIEDEEESDGELDSSKENDEETPKVITKSKKRKESETKQKLKDGKKARREIRKNKLDHVEEDGNVSEETEKESKKKKLSNLKSKTKLKLKKDASIRKKGKSKIDFEIEELAQIRSAPSDNKPTEHMVPSLHLPAENGIIIQSGTHFLMQHVAPHVVGSKKSKRRESCDARLQTASQQKQAKSTDSPFISKPEIGTKNKKRKSLGWDEPLQEGEFEIFIPKEEILARKRRLSDANTSLSGTPKSKTKNPLSSPIPGLVPPITPNSSAKRVNFVLQKNTAQATSEYFKTLRENPAIPFDAKKEPPRSVLKPSPYNSPVNPFYKCKLKM